MTQLHYAVFMFETNGHKVDLSTTKDKDILLQVKSRFGETITMVFDGKGKGNFLYFL